MLKRRKLLLTGNLNISYNKTYIYILYDPTFISDTFYVGKSVGPKGRLSQHFSEAKYDKKNVRKNNWIKSVKEVAAHIVGVVPENITWQEAEKAVIVFLRWCGVSLANITSGGDSDPNQRGSKNGRALLNEQQVIEIIKLLVQDVPTRKISEQFNVKYHTIQSIRKGTTWKNVYDLLDEETRKKLDELRNNKYANGEIKTKQIHLPRSSWNKNKKMPQEFCDKISIAGKERFRTSKQWNAGLKMSSEYCEKLSQLNSGKNNPFYNKHHTNDTKTLLSNMRRGEGSGMSKLTEKQVIQILIDICDGISVKEIHKKYAFISEDTIRRIKKGRVWEYVIELLPERNKQILIEIRGRDNRRRK